MPVLPTVGRWEWRTFGGDLADTERRLAALPVQRDHESEELYVLAPRGDASVKVRDGLLDVKELQDARDGLEQWLPVLKAPLPLDPDGARRVAAALAVDAPAAPTVEALVAAVPELRAVRVHKRRRHYVVDGCMVELTDLRTADRATRTLAVEAEDPSLVGATVRALGLSGRENVSMVRGIRALAGPRRAAVIDVGTNSVKFVLAERGEDGAWRALAERAEVTRLGEALERTGRLGEEPVARTVDAIARMVADARGAERVAAVGTAGLRQAENAAEFLTAVRARCGLDVEVISGEDEARLAYVAATSALALPAGPVVVFDSGGGSSQFTFGDREHVAERFSVDVGAVRVTERFGLDHPVGEEAVGAAIAAIARELVRLDGRRRPELVIGMGGTVTNLAAVRHELETYDPDLVHGTVLDRAEIDRQIERFRTRTAAERRALPGLQPRRAEIILAGACIVRCILTLLGADALTVSDRALRHGVLAERFGRG